MSQDAVSTDLAAVAPLQPPPPNPDKAKAYADFGKRLVEYGRQRLRWREASNFDKPGLCRWCGGPTVPPARFCGRRCEAKHKLRVMQTEKDINTREQT